MSATLRTAAATLVVACALGASLAPAAAEGSLRVAQQYGITYLPFEVIRAHGLVEKHAARLGVEVETEWRTVSGGAATNDALLSGSVDVASAGVGPMLTVWDRTHGRQNVRAISAMGTIPSAIVTTDPSIRTLADIGPEDRIAVPAVGVSQQARTLQYAAAQQFGIENWDRFERNTVSLPNPEAAQAIISGNASITAHFANQPYRNMELAAPGAHVVLDADDLFGGEPTTTQVNYATEAWREDNPKTYEVFIAALDEAHAWIDANPEAAADVYIAGSGGDVDRDLVIQVLKDPKVNFSIVPVNTGKMADFMYEIGAIKNKPASWRDYFFENLHDRAGS